MPMFALFKAEIGIFCTLIMCDSWFVKLCIPENRSPDIRNSHFPPSLCSFFLVGRSPSCPVGVGLSLLLPVFFFFVSFWRWKLTKASKALQPSFLPLLIDFTLQLFYHCTHPPTHTHTHTKLSHSVSYQQSLSSHWLSHTHRGRFC